MKNLSAALVLGGLLFFGFSAHALVVLASTNLVPNSALETANGASPASWLQGGWGTNTAVFTYPSPGAQGNGAKLQVTKYTSGDAKWYFTPVAVSANTLYTVADDYQSTASTMFMVQVTSTTGVNSYIDLGPAPAAAAWTHFTKTFTAPAGAASVTIFHGLQSTGTLTIDNMSLSAGSGTSTPATSTPPVDTTKPTVSLSSPSTAAILSGAVTLSATASDNVGIAGIQFFIDSVAYGAEGTTSPYSLTLNTATLTNATHTIAVRARDAAGNAATSTKTVTVLNVVVPAPNPVVTSFMATPAHITAGQTTQLAWKVTGATSISLNQGIGTVVGTSTSVMPTATTTYTLTAANAAGTTTAQTTVTVAPVVVTPPPVISNNLIPNPSFALSTAQGAGVLPQSWNTGSWGAASGATFAYPVAGEDDAFAAQATVPTYGATGLGNGAAEWYFNSIPVTGGALYTFSDWYNSTANSYIIAQWTLSDNTVEYDAVQTLSSTGGAWQKSSNVFSAPANATSVTIFQELQSVGTLTVDNFSLTAGSVGQAPLQKAIVSLTFDDGWESQYVNALPILKAAHFGGTFYIITDDIDTAPVYDFFTDPNEDIATTKKATSMTWAPIYTDPTVSTLLFTDAYAASAPVKVTASYVSGGKTVSQAIGTFAAGSATSSLIFTLPTVSGGTVSPITITETSTAALTASKPSLTEYDLGYMTPAQLLTLQSAGNEIASHTVTHDDLTAETFAQVATEFANSMAQLKAWGASPVDGLAYPLGNYSATIESQAASAGYTNARSVDIGYNTKTTDKFALKTDSVVATTPFSVVKSWIDTAVANKLWLVLTFHDVDTQDIITLNGEVFGTTPAILQQIVDYLNTQQSAGNLQVKTMHDALPLVQ